MSDNEQKEIDTTQPQDEEPPLLKPTKKRGPKTNYKRTDKQMEQFQKAYQKRQENIETRKQEKKIEAAKLLLSIEKPKKEVVKKKKKKHIVVESESESDSYESDSEPESSEEEEIVYAKQRKSIKVPKKVYILKKDDSDDEKPIAKSKTFKSQQNKRSVIKVREAPPENKTIYNPRNYFCD